VSATGFDNVVKERPVNRSVFMTMLWLLGYYTQKPYLCTVKNITYKTDSHGVQSSKQHNPPARYDAGQHPPVPALAIDTLYIKEQMEGRIVEAVGLQNRPHSKKMKKTAEIIYLS
jgi:hypothetical protein